MISAMTSAEGRITEAKTYLNRQGEPRIQLTASRDLTIFLDVPDALQLIKILSDAVVTAQALKPEVAA
ncbi:MAG TPA: hypothetical protein VM639_24375 [Dongiaceae bacterium]|nr:hypothetical protein [Dongiaceae bacterium]